MTPTKQEIEQKLQRMATFVDGTVTRINDLLDLTTNNPKLIKKQLHQLGKQSVVFIRKQQLEVEIKVLKLRLQEIKKRIAIEQRSSEEGNTQPS
ncbi:MAG: hypothetical protein HN580_04280 [Deltaproteobacteria bacterium]|jgi:hypothetical protein|nr:hypothetical protein [Deltaproteobacteria bacterium]MBT4639093.1 hypothetical protein [Deltaproteobacteria bacterium]MBT6501167.1 hypothetical protein [Deltaproteobacteria bacterium]MBT7151487.1 hypothetical protein [Deltaproteobacteria bacterium]MBT7716340.1 hypothetical protein [Deltaproteobacteria bacterium]